MMEWLANLSWRVVVAIVAVLAVLRLILGRRKSRPARFAAETAESLAVAVAVVYLVIKPFLIQAFFIPSGSMNPTLMVQDHIMVNKLIYRVSEPKHGDILVFRAPPDATPDGKEKDFIKRVMGLPGDTLEVRRGYVSVGAAQYGHLDLKRGLSTYAPRGEVRVKLRDDGVYVNGDKVTKRQVAIAFGDPDAPVRIHPGYVVRNGKILREPHVAEDPDEPMGLVKVPPNTLFVMGDNRNDSNDSRKWGTLERERVLGKAMFIFWPLNRIRWMR